MATTNRTADVLLRYSVDTASVNRVRASFTNLESELDDLRAELTGVGTSAQRGVAALRQRFGEGERAVEGMQDEVEQLRRDLLALDDVKVTPVVDVQRAGAGAAGDPNPLDEVDRGGRVAGQILSGLGQGEAANAAGLIGDVAGAFTALNPAMLATVAVGGALTLVVGQLTKAYEEAKTAANEYLAAQTEINALIVRGDAEGLEARRAQLETDIAARNRTTASLSALIARFDELQIGADAILAGQEDLNTTGLNYAEILQEQERVIAQIGVETDGQITNIGVLRDSIAGFDEETAKLQSDLLLVENGIAQLGQESQDKRAALQPLADTLGRIITLAIPAAEGLGRIVEELKEGQNFQRGTGKGFSFPTKDVFLADQAAAKAAQEALSGKRTDAYLAAITETVQAQDTLRRAQEAYNEAVNASAARIAEINAKLQEDLSRAEAERQSDLAEAARDAGEERVKVTEDAEKERARIQRRFERTYSDAVAERDALAAKRAEDQRDDELKELDERYKDQLKTVDKSLAAQQRTIEARYQQQVATINAAAQSAVRTEQAAAQARLSALQQGVQAAQTALINAQQSEFLIRANYYNQAVSQAQVWANLMQLYTSYGFSLPGGTGGSYGGGGGRVLPTPLADGGPAYANTPYLVGEQGPELFVPAQSGRIIPNGAAFTINVVGAQSDTIRVVSRQQALAAFDRVIGQMGVA